METIGYLIDVRKLVLAFSPDTIAELRRAVQYPHILEKAYKQGIDPVFIVELLAAHSIVVTPYQYIAIIKDDPDDNAFLACAVTVRASFIVSGDKHLLALKSFAGIPIVTPRAFLFSF